MKHIIPIILSLILIVILLTGCAGIQKWDKKDQILFGTFAGIHTVDIFQTREIMIDNNGYKELNPILDGLSRDQATAAMLGGYAHNGNLAIGLFLDPGASGQQDG